MPSYRHVLPLLILGLLACAEPGVAQDDPAALARIRRALSEERLNLQIPDLQADFRVEVFGRWSVDEIFSHLNVGGPVPAGGFYGYEQQRRLFNPINRPLMQPYAAFGPRQLAAIALEIPAEQYLRRTVSAWLSRRQERAAKTDVAEAIADYCAQREDRADIAICTTP